jgi:predicted  nucleic acid-binding Zn-ribbon protein
MDWGGPDFVIAIIAISTFGWLASSWIRAKHGYPLENEWSGITSKEGPAAERKIELLTNENERLTGQISRLEERLSVLERIATDPAERTAREIENLRHKP